ncbi:protein SOB FIVE-LIKE 5 isoform X2 [Cannabis sativa]|uniref:protein SOB FIVE-LIKE 5 isoform X2 n=1 Tax=Cannabis sativa TaxID=3483 RepID=UPI0011DF6B7A|nr:protein SOB FIVE-LIKE 5 isoform X2 [Cannabis sativa]
MNREKTSAHELLFGSLIRNKNRVKREIMNISTSKFSGSGCESGWTLYLEESNISEADKLRIDHKEEKENDCGYEEGEEEDLSMVSDASSGPPHYHEDDHDHDYNENGSYISFSSSWAYNKSTNKDKKKMMKSKMKEKCTEEEHRSCLDDTASSPVSKKKSTFSRSKALMDNVVDHSQGFSATHRGESAMGKHVDLYQSPMTKYSASQEPVAANRRNGKSVVKAK